MFSKIIRLIDIMNRFMYEIIVKLSIIPFIRRDLIVSLRKIKEPEKKTYVRDIHAHIRFAIFMQNKIILFIN